MASAVPPSNPAQPVHAVDTPHASGEVRPMLDNGADLRPPMDEMGIEDMGMDEIGIDDSGIDDSGAEWTLFWLCTSMLEIGVDATAPATVPPAPAGSDVAGSEAIGTVRAPGATVV